MKRILRLAVAAALACCAQAADFGALRPDGYLSDFAHVVPPDRKKAIEDYCRRVEDATGAQIALVTLPSLEGEPIEDVANLLFRKWGVGSKKDNNGILLLLALRERRSRIEVGYGLEPIIPDGYVGGVLRELRPALAAGDYGAVMTRAAETLGSRIAQARGLREVPATGLRSFQRVPAAPRIPFLVIIVFVVLVLALLSKLGRSGPPRGPRLGGGGPGFLTGLILGNLARGGWGGRRSSGGGFGGFDAGGGFGGFGGGDSGGGGASSDW
jgi:uncharacterized protein